MSSTIVPANTPEQNRFKTIRDFKDCIRWGGEVEFSWNGIRYDVTHCSSGEISIAAAYQQNTEKLCATPDEALDYMVGNDRLWDVITKVTVLDRTI